MKSTIAMIAGLFLVASTSYAGVTIDGTTITFSDASMQSTAKPSDHGGTNNTINGTVSFIGGGYYNEVTDDFGTIGGGTDNQAGDAGGNSSDRQHATVGGGWGNVASGERSTVSGGAFNVASGFSSTIAGGRFHEASGDHSAVGGGFDSTASGDYSFVAGRLADDSGNNNSFVWGGALGVGGNSANPRTSAAPDTFNVWSAGIYFNGSVHFSSDRDMKEAFSFVSAREVLDKVLEMPVTTWRFKTEDDSVRHIGPTAQDFMSALGYGADDTHITATDADGVALAAIQGLNAKLEDTREELAAQAEISTALRWHNAQLRAMLRSRDESFEVRFARLEEAILREGERAPAASTD